MTKFEFTGETKVNDQLLNPVRDFEHFEDLVDDAKTARRPIFINGRRLDARKSKFEDIDDVFDNGINVNYEFREGALHFKVRN